MTDTTTLVVLGRGGLRFGAVVWRNWVTSDETGWQYLPATSAHKPSRKLWGTPQKAIPDWVGPYTMVPIHELDKQ